MAQESVLAGIAGVDQLATPGERVAYDVQISVMSLLGIFGITHDTVPPPPWLASGVERRSGFQHGLAATCRLNLERRDTRQSQLLHHDSERRRRPEWRAR